MSRLDLSSRPAATGGKPASGERLAGPKRGMAAMVPAGLVIGLGGMAFNVVVGRVAGAAAYGAIGTLLIAGTIGSFSAQGVQYELAASVSRSGKAGKGGLWPMLALVWPWLAVAGAGLAAAGPLAGFLHLSSPVPVDLAIALFVVTIISALPQGVLVGAEWFVTIAGVGVAMAAARIGLGVWLTAALPSVTGSLLASVAAVAAGGTAFFLVASLCLRRNGRTRGLDVHQSWDAGVQPVSTSPALRGGVLAVLLWVALSVPLLAARHLLAPTTAGRFAATQTLAAGIVFVTAPIVPAFYASIARSRKMVTAVFGLACTAGVAAVAIAGLVVLGPSVVRLFYGASFASPSSLFAALGFSASLIACLSYALWAGSALCRRREVSAAILVASATEALLVWLWHSGPQALALGPGVAVASASALVASVTIVRQTLVPHAEGQRERRHGGQPGLSSGHQLSGPIGLAPIAPDHVPADALPVTVGIMAYNEEASVEAVIAGYLAQHGGVTRLAEVVVVASGCTDETVERAQRVADASGRVRVIIQPTRDGKLAAVRTFLSAVDTDAVVISGADTVPSPDLLEAMGARLVADAGVGMVGGRIIPIPGKGSLAESLHAVLWALHHQVALRSPKLGEIVALRRSFVGELQDGVNCDEVALEAAVIASGGRLAYEPRAVVGNRGPTTLRDYLDQRRRIRCQHMDADMRLGYRPATASTRLAVRAIFAHLSRHPQDLVAVIGAVTVEAVASVLGHYDHHRGLDYRVWVPALSARTGSLKQVVSLASSEERL